MSVAAEIGQKIYYKSFEHLASDIDKRIQNSNIAMETHYTTRAMLYLLWSGFTIDEIIDVEKSWVRNEGVYDPSSGIVHELPEEGVEFLRKYANTQILSMIGDEKEYLLRTRLTSHMTKATMHRAISKFNIVCDYPTSLKLSDAYESGLFYRVWQKQKSGLEFPVYRRNHQLTDEGLAFYEQLFERSFPRRFTITEFMRRYQYFVDKFYKEESTTM